MLFVIFCIMKNCLSVLIVSYVSCQPVFLLNCNDGYSFAFSESILLFNLLFKSVFELFL